MKITKIAFIITIAAATLAVPAAFAEKAGNRGKIVSQGGEAGDVCYELDVKEDEAYIRKAEAAEKAGRLKEAFDAATGNAGIHGCWNQSEGRRVGIIERTYKQLGQEAEKAGRLYEAHKYFIYPFDRYIAPNYFRDRFEKAYSLADAHRTMLAYAKADPDDYMVVEEAVRYFARWEDKPPQLKEVRDLAIRGGDKLLAKEEKAFAARRHADAFELLEEAERWLNLADHEHPSVRNRAKMRVDSLLAESSYDAIERAFDYTNVRLLGNTYTISNDAARARAGKLGDEAERKGDLELAERFYSLADDAATKDAISRRITANKEQQEKQKVQAEAKRQEQFHKDQKSLEDELGF